MALAVKERQKRKRPSRRQFRCAIGAFAENTKVKTGLTLVNVWSRCPGKRSSRRSCSRLSEVALLSRGSPERYRARLAQTVRPRCACQILPRLASMACGREAPGNGECFISGCGRVRHLFGRPMFGKFELSWTAGISVDAAKLKVMGDLPSQSWNWGAKAWGGIKV